MIYESSGREGEAFATYGIDEWKIRNCNGRTIREHLQYGSSCFGKIREYPVRECVLMQPCARNACYFPYGNIKP